MKLTITDYTKREHVYERVEKISIHDAGDIIYLRFKDNCLHYHAVEVECINEHVKIEIGDRYD